MGENSKIQWTDMTFNPWIGCSKVSPGCKNCYAEADMDKRRGRVSWGVNGTRSVTSYMYWRKVLSWNRDAIAAGVRGKVFCASLADVFEEFSGAVIDSHGDQLFWPQYESYDEFEGRNDMLAGTIFDSLTGNLRFECVDCDNIPTFSHHTKKHLDQQYDHTHADDQLDGHSQYKKSFFKPLTIEIIRIWLFKLIEQTPGLDWLLLTKRPENIMKMVPEEWQQEFPSNVWIGTSVEDQEMANLRIPQLLKVPAAIRFLSCEPLLSKIDLRLDVCQTPTIGGIQWTAGELLDWVIVGGESGRNKRPFDCDWARSIRNQCKKEFVDFFMKQVDKIQPIPEDLNIMEFPK